jgi:excinuclease ABC subunit B
VPTAAEEMAEYGYEEDALKKLEAEMKEAAKKLDFERAAMIRDKIKGLRQKMIELGLRETNKR